MDQVRYTKMEGVLPLEITHYLPQKATMVALLEGVGHAMPSGWSIQNFVVFRRKKLPLPLGRATGIPPPLKKKKYIYIYLGLCTWH